MVALEVHLFGVVLRALDLISRLEVVLRVVLLAALVGDEQRLDRARCLFPLLAWLGSELKWIVVIQLVAFG